MRVRIGHIWLSFSGYIHTTPKCIFPNGSYMKMMVEFRKNFGDGSDNSTGKNPVHTYTAGGIYNVTLTVTNLYGSFTLQKTRGTSPSRNPRRSCPADPTGNSTPSQASQLIWQITKSCSLFKDRPEPTTEKTSILAQTSPPTSVTSASPPLTTSSFPPGLSRQIPNLLSSGSKSPPSPSPRHSFTSITGTSLHYRSVTVTQRSSYSTISRE